MKKQRGYLHRVLAAKSRRPDLFQPGDVSQLHVAHDGWCKSDHGKKPGNCNCFPDITIATPRGTFSIDQEGGSFAMN